MRSKFANAKQEKRQSRRVRVRRRIARSERPRLTIFRSARHIYAQIVDPGTGRTLMTVSTRSKGICEEGKGTGNVEAARRVGQAIAAAAREKNIDTVVFNRNGFLYHGRVKALADAAREAGLRF